MSFATTSYYVTNAFSGLKSNITFIEWEDLEGLSIDNEHFPFFAIKINMAIYGKRIIQYSIPVGTENSRQEHFPLKTYPKLLSALNSNSLPIAFRMKSMAFTLYIFKGCIFEKVEGKVNILFMVGIRTAMIPSIVNREILGDENLAIFVSSDFVTNPKYKNIYKKMYDSTITPGLKKGMELIVTKSIEKRCFKNNVPTPKFKNVTQMQDYLKSFNKAIANGS